MESVVLFLLSVQLALGPSVWASELFRYLVEPPQVVDLSRLEILTTTNELSGAQIQIGFIPEPSPQSPAMTAFELGWETLFAPTGWLIANSPEVCVVAEEIVRVYLDFLEIPDLHLIESEEP